jgi:outer membrane protein assembly factor BamB
MPRSERIIFAGTGRHVIALNSATGEEIWRTRLPSGTSNIVSLMLVGDFLYAGHSGRVYCLDPLTGAIRWENSLRRTGYSAVILGAAGSASSAAVVGAVVAAQAVANAAAASAASASAAGGA